MNASYLLIYTSISDILPMNKICIIRLVKIRYALGVAHVSAIF